MQYSDSFPTERLFNCATLMRRHIVFAVIRNFSKFAFDNLRKFLLLCNSHIIKKTPLGMPVIPFPSEGVFNSAIVMQAMCLHIQVAELNTPSDGNSAYQ